VVSYTSTFEQACGPSCRGRHHTVRVIDCIQRDLRESFHCILSNTTCNNKRKSHVHHANQQNFKNHTAVTMSAESQAHAELLLFTMEPILPMNHINGFS
jgi:hypothetical protein